MITQVEHLRPYRHVAARAARARWSIRAYFHFGNWRLPAAMAASVLAAVFVGNAATVSHSRAVVIVFLVAALAATARLGVVGLAGLVAATLPWLVVAGTRLPRLTETLAAAALTALVILVAVPKRDTSSRSFLLRLGIVCFYAPVIVSLGQEGSGEQFIQAGKYVVFPAMVLAVTEATNYRDLIALRTVALASGILAVLANLLLGLAGFGGSSLYGAGEIVGLAREHDLALLAGCLTAATLAGSASLKSWPPVVVGAIATVATGVRSTLPGLALVVIARMVAAGARIRTLVLMAAAAIALFASGAADVVAARFHGGEERGEFESFSAFGSGRGELYSTAIDSWRASAPIHWFIGTGLRSIPKFEQEKLGSTFVGHSDIVEVGIQLGLIGLVGLILIWWVLVARARSKSPLLVLASFAAFNGALEYSAPLVLALLLTVGAKHDRDDVSPNDPGLTSSRSPRRFSNITQAASRQWP